MYIVEVTVVTFICVGRWTQATLQIFIDDFFLFISDQLLIRLLWMKS